VHVKRFCSPTAAAAPTHRTLRSAAQRCQHNNTLPACPCQQTLLPDATLPLPDCPQASAVGDFDQAADRWRDVLRAYPGRPALWRAYLAFRQTHFASFTARKLRHLHDDAMDVRPALSAAVKMLSHAECCA
jgi:NRDE-2, necessary for RNA interference